MTATSPAHAGERLAARVPPHDSHAEKNFIGCVFVDPRILDQSTLRPDEMYVDYNRRALAVALALRDAGKTVDTETVAEALAAEIGKEAAVNLCFDAVESVPYAAGWESFVDTIRKEALRRRLLSTGMDLARSALDESSSIDDVLAGTFRELREIEERRAGGGGVSSIADAVAEFDEWYRSADPAGIPTGLADVDKLLGGLKTGQLIIVAARPGQGKTALAITIARHVAGTSVPVMVFSLELTRREIVQRLVAGDSGLSGHDIAAKSLEEYQTEAMRWAMESIASLPIRIDERCLSVSQIGSLVRMHVQREGVRVVVIDYLSLIGPEDRKAPREQQVATMTRQLKTLAKDLGIAVILLAQLNRALEQRSDRKPQLSDLRESGAIEQDADVVGFIERPIMSDENADQHEAWLYVRKHRNGPTGQIRLHYHGPTFRFCDHIPHYGGQ